MGAAEKLEWLNRLLVDPQETDPEAAEVEAGYHLIAALPELVAVVRAAQTVEETGALVIDSEWADLTAALAALDARLVETEQGKDLGAEPGGSAGVEVDGA